MKFCYEEFRLYAEALRQGEDVLIRIWGGDSPHIGSVAAAQPRPSLSGSGSGSATVSVFNYTGHLDDAVAVPVAKAVCSRLGVRTAVVCGIHYEGAPADLLQKVAALSARIAEDLIIALETE